MREKERIERVMGLVKEFWNEYQNFRFFQLIELIEILYSKDNDDFGRFDNNIDLFYLEDDKFENWLRNTLTKGEL